MKNNKIYWYKTPQGKIVDESVDSAWKVHGYNLRFRGFKYLGWSSGNHIKQASSTTKRNKDGITQQATQVQKTKVQEAVKLELEEAKTQLEPPKRQQVKELVGGHQGVITDPQTPGLLGKVNKNG